MVKTYCPSCGMLLSLPDEEFLGRNAVCPQCQHRFILSAEEKKQETRLPPPRKALMDTVSFANPAASSAKAKDSGRLPPPRAETISSRRTVNQIAEFTLLEELGQGAFGTVYRAKDNSLGRLVALKIPKASLFDSNSPEEFVREARLAAQLRHPNILTIHQVGVASGVPFIVTDLVEGTDLAAVLKNGPIKPRSAANLCRKMAAALQTAHQAGIVHRDLKPANILLDKSREPLIADFGLAKSLHTETSTTDGAIKGTPAYMSPEQAKGNSKDTDGRSDLFSLGIILYEMLTGIRPFQGDKWSVLHKIISENPKPISALNAEVPEVLERICFRCLAKRPEDRYPNAKALHQDLSIFLQGKVPDMPPEKRPRGSGRFKIWTASLIVVFALVGWGGWSLLKSPPEENPEKVKEPRRRDSRSEESGPLKLTGKKTTTDPEGLKYARLLLTRTQRETVNIEFIDNPLIDVTEFLGDACGMTIRIDDVALEGEGTSRDEPVTQSLAGVSLDSALDQILTPLGLTWIPMGFGKNGKWVQPENQVALHITTQFQEETLFETILYPIGDIVETQRDVESLIATIKQDPKLYWDESELLQEGSNGPPLPPPASGSGMNEFLQGGTITFVEQGQLLSINQTWNAHKRILNHLDRFRSETDVSPPEEAAP